MRGRRFLLVTLLGVLLRGALPPACGAAPSAHHLAAGGRVGTGGLGPVVAVRLGRKLDARFAAGWLRLDRTYDATGIRYDGHLRIAHLEALLDLRPSGSGFHLTGGVVADGDRLEGSAPLADLVRRDVPSLPPGIDLGRAVGRATVNPVAPYLGLGWGARAGAPGWHASFDLGVVYHGSPHVDLRAETTLPVESIPGGRAELDRLIADEERKLESELASDRYLPIVALGVSYGF